MERPRVSVKKLTVILSIAFVVLTLLIGIFAFFFLQNTDSKETIASGENSSSQAKEDSSAKESEDSKQSDNGDKKQIASEKSTSSGKTPEESSRGDESSSKEVPSSEVQKLNSQEAKETSSSQSTPEEKENSSDTQPSFNMPPELRGVMVSSGTDYAVGTDSASVVAAQLDGAIANASELKMNTLILNPGQGSVFGFDSIDYIVSKAREMGLYVFLCYDVREPLGEEGAVDSESLNKAEKAAEEFARSYQPDAIFLDNYASPTEASSYGAYLANGSGIGYENYLKCVPESLLRTTAAALRRGSPNTQVGLFSGAVWENSVVESSGSLTASTYTDLGGGNADTKAMIEDGLFDCVMVKNYGSTVEQTANFGVVAAWWEQLAINSDVTLYMMHACDRIGTKALGWDTYEQLTKQIVDIEKLSGVSGSAFNSLKVLMENKENAIGSLTESKDENGDKNEDENGDKNEDEKDDKKEDEKVDEKLKEEYVLTQLSLSKPDQLTFTTKEQVITFQGASDPQEKVTLNGAEIETNESGYFTIQERLEPGVNKFEIKHKDKSVNYTITRQVEVLKEIQPVGNMTVEGGMQIRVTALAYESASVSASIDGQQIALAPAEDLQDEALRNTGYVMYAGTFTAPTASAAAVNMGTLTVTATAQGTTKSLQGATVTVNKVATVGNGGVIQVVSDQAETFPIGALDDTSSPSHYPLPKGTMDVTNGDPIVYNVTVDGVPKNYKYWKLQSGVRVYGTDIQSLNTVMPDNNVISQMSIKSSAQYTAVSLVTVNKVPYTVSYDGSNIVFSFKYTVSTPNSVTLQNNAIFAAANWSGSTLTLRLRKSGGFIGYKAYYEGNTLILRFNNPSGSLSGARIVVDPGHGGNDPGASGFYPGKDEADINLAIAQKLVAELQGRGAAVLMTTPGSTMASRMAAAKAFNPQVLVSIHGNSSKANPGASGTEAYYFYPFSKQLASNITANIASSLGGNNRGAKSGLYYVTRESQFASVLVETGFVTNEVEYTKLINSNYQTRVAQGIANGISGYLGGANSGGGTGGTDDIVSGEDPKDESSKDAATESTLKLSESSLSLYVDDTAKLSFTGVDSVEWTSDDTEVARVSASGKIMAMGEGTTYIWAYAGKLEAKCKVKVQSSGGGNNENTEDSIQIDGTSSLYVGDRANYTATLKPSGFSDVEWWTENDSILTIVESSGESCRVEAVGKGTTYLCIEAKNNRDISQRIKIQVSD